MEISTKKKWYERIPHPYILLFFIVVLAGIMTYLVPAGEFERTKIAGRMAVVPGTFHYIAQSPVSFFDLFKAIPLGMIASSSIIFITFISGALFNVLESTGALENGVGVTVKKLGADSYKKLIWIVTLIFGFLGATVGFENNIALVPIAVFVAIALGGDLMVGAGMAVAGIGMGFATSPINPYTIGTSDMIAQLPMFSGAGLRSLFCFTAVAITAHHTCRYMARILDDPSQSLVADISTEGLRLTHPIEEYHLKKSDKLVLTSFLIGLGIILYGVFKWKWYINEMSAIFIMIAIAAGLFAKMSPSDIINKMIQGAGNIAGRALVIGVARGIQVLLDMGHVSDTIVNALASPLQHLPTILSAILMTLVHSVINFFIPSGSGQAMATMPIMIPLSDLIGMTRQTAIMAFQVGDGIMNLIFPTVGGLLAMLALARVPFDRWFRFCFPLIIKILLASWIFLTIAVLINWGPA